RRRHTRSKRDWSSDVCSSDLDLSLAVQKGSARVARVYRSAKLNRARNREVSGNRVLNCPSNLTDDSKSHRTGKAERVSNCDVRRSEERRVGKEWRWQRAAEA